MAFGTLVLAVPGTAARAQGGAQPPWLELSLQARRLGGMRAQAATLLVQGGRAGAIALEVLAAPTQIAPGEGDRRIVPVLIEIEGPSLLGDENSAEEELRSIEVYAYALTPEGAVKAFFTQRFRISLESLGERIFNSGVKFVGALELPPGEYSLRVLVLDVAHGRYGLRTSPLAVPAPGDGRPRLLASLVSEPTDRWLLVRQDTRAAPPPGLPEAAATQPGPSPEAAVAPLLIGPEASLPSALPVLDSGRLVEVHLLAHGVGGAPKISVRLEPEAADSPPQTLPVKLVARLATPIPDLERLSGHFTLPQLPTGAFGLRFLLEVGGPAETPPLRTLILADNPVGEPLVWGELRSVAAALERTAETGSGALELPKRRKKRESALEQAASDRYLEALRRASEGGSLESALETLAGIESQLFEMDPSTALGALRAGELAVAEALGAIEPESLLPLVVYHIDLYRRYRSTKAFALATHARTLAQELAERYTVLSGTEAASLLASQAMTSLARDLLEGGLRGAAAATLDRAIQLDSRNERAFLLLAALYERVADYRRAVETLERLVAFYPKSAEGRLRLALNRYRLGDTAAAERDLTRLIDERNPAWTLTVAYTELARMYLETGRSDQATTLLRQAIDRLPRQDRFYIQLAFVLDRQRQFHEARELLARFEQRGVRDRASTTSPRHRYAIWPDEGLAEARSSLAEGASTRQPLLAATLQRLPEAAASGRSGS